MTQAGSASSAERPGKDEHLPLSQLNKASAKTGATWIVAVVRPKEDTYEYSFKGQSKHGSNFIVILVSPDDPSVYCQAQFKKNSKNSLKYEQAKKNFSEGRRLVISKVCFAEDAKIQYVSPALKFVVDLSATKIDFCAEAISSVVQPAPTATVAGSASLAGNQFFDCTGLVQEVQESREHTNNRSSFVVMIYDGSLDASTKKVKVIPLKIFYDTWQANNDEQSMSGEKIRALAEEHMQKKTALSFFCISGAKDDDDKFTFRNTKHTVIIPAAGKKADKLKAATELHNLSATDTVVFDLQTSASARDWTVEKGRETRCGLLSIFGRNSTNVDELDSGETIWQLNWMRITEPAREQTIKNQYGNLWLPLTCRDDTGFAIFYITEKAVIKLTNVVDAAEFEQLHSEGRLCFPFFSSIKILRRPKNSAVQPGSTGTITTLQPENNKEFDCYIVDAMEQNFEEIPSSSSLKFLPMLQDTSDSALYACLAMIRKSEHYALSVEYVCQKVPEELSQVASKTIPGVPFVRACSHALAIVLSTRRSKVSNAGSSGHRLVTENVIDFLHPDSAEQPVTPQQYTLISFCTLENVTDFKLDPPKSSKHQAALISVTGVIGDSMDDAEQPAKSLIVDDVQLLSPQQANAMKPMFLKSFLFGALAGQISNKRAHVSWSCDENPAAPTRCRTLGRSPTGPALPDYAPSPTKT